MGKLLRPKSIALALVSAFFIIIPAIVRKRLSRLDFGLFCLTVCIFNAFDTMKMETKRLINRLKRFQGSLVKHSSPLTLKYFFKNENAADRITLLGVWINILLSGSKLIGGMLFNSAVLVADAGHSMSDLFSDFITLWAVQVARIPADEDHPYGHGKFESIGSLFLSLTLLATGLSVGTWSYDKMKNVLLAPSEMVLPSWPALILAAFSIASKEWLFRVTRRVGNAMNSQILIANAWHHRSDAFSSVLSLASIAIAMAAPGLLVVDSAAGILVAGMICMTGMEVLIESIKQLSDTNDRMLENKVKDIVRNVEGVLGVKSARTRTVGSGNLIDINVITDSSITASAANNIVEKCKWNILEQVPNAMDVSVKNSPMETVCPLLTQNTRTIPVVEREVNELLVKYHKDGIVKIRKITVNYVSTAMLTIELLIQLNPTLSIDQATTIGKSIQSDIRNNIKDVYQAEVYLNISGWQETTNVNTAKMIQSLP